MTNIKSLTKSDLVIALKEMKVATKDDLKNLATKEELKNLATKEDLKNLVTKDDLRSEILASERRLKLRIGKVRNDLADRIANLALTTPTRREFEELKHN